MMEIVELFDEKQFSFLRVLHATQTPTPYNRSHDLAIFSMTCPTIRCSFFPPELYERSCVFSNDFQVPVIQ